MTVFKKIYTQNVKYYPWDKFISTLSLKILITLTRKQFQQQLNWLTIITWEGGDIYAMLPGRQDYTRDWLPRELLQEK